MNTSTTAPLLPCDASPAGTIVRRRRLGQRWTATVCAALALLAAPAAAQPANDLQRADGVVQTAGWRLATANAPSCTNVRPAVGLLLQDAGNYDDPALARRVLGLTHDIAVQAAAQGSPAEAAGLLANQPLLALEGRDLAALPQIRPGDWRRLEGLTDTIELALLTRGEVSLVVERGGAPVALTLRGVPACTARFELSTSRSGARASGERVIVTRTIHDQVAGDPDMVAAIIAHELAHVVLGHRNLKRMPVKAQEEEADRLSVWLLRNAGYDPHVAVRFQQSWGKAHDKGLLSAPDHNRWKKRAAQMEAEIAAMEAATGRTGYADWGRLFVRWRKT